MSPSLDGLSSSPRSSPCHQSQHPMLLPVGAVTGVHHPITSCPRAVPTPIPPPRSHGCGGSHHHLIVPLSPFALLFPSSHRSPHRSHCRGCSASISPLWMPHLIWEDMPITGGNREGERRGRRLRMLCRAYFFVFPRQHEYGTRSIYHVSEINNLYYLRT